MDSFEINKIVACILVVALVFIGLANFSEILYHVEKPKVAAYQVEGGDEILMDKFKMGEESPKKTKKSTMVVESHITYNQEVKEGDEVDVNLLYFDHDKKRLQYKLEMIHKEKKFLASTIEILSLYVDLDQRKVSEFESEKITIMKEFIKSNSQKFKSDNLIFSNKLKK